MVVSTAHSGNWYSMVGTVSEVRNELNRVNAQREDIIVAGDNGSGQFTFILHGDYRV